MMRGRKDRLWGDMGVMRVQGTEGATIEPLGVGRGGGYDGVAVALGWGCGGVESQSRALDLGGRVRSGEEKGKS